MRTILICLAILVIVIPVVIIVGNISGKTLITHEEYFFLVLAFIVTYFLEHKKVESEK